MSFTSPYKTLTAALFLTLGTVAVTFAQQVPGQTDGQAPGFVRITDRTMQPDGQNVQQTGGFHGFHGHFGGAPCPNGSCPQNMGYGSGFVPNGNCPTGNCPPGGYGYGNCPSGQCPYCRGGFHGMFCDHYCKQSPGHGYTPPAKYPLLRRGVQYDTMYPAQWYGAGGECLQSSAPMVYQPTDTTQLGYYYRHVPFWQPYPNPMPARPIPAQWHISPAPIRAYGNNFGYYSHYFGGHGHLLHHRHARYYQGGYGMYGSCPVDVNGMPLQNTNPAEVVPPAKSSPTPVNAPAPASPEALPPEGDASAQELPQTSLPPAPSTPADEGFDIPRSPLPVDSASSGHIRRIGDEK